MGSDRADFKQVRCNPSRATHTPPSLSLSLSNLKLSVISYLCGFCYTPSSPAPSPIFHGIYPLREYLPDPEQIGTDPPVYD